MVWPYRPWCGQWLFYLLCQEGYHFFSGFHPYYKVYPLLPLGWTQVCLDTGLNTTDMPLGGRMADADGKLIFG